MKKFNFPVGLLTSLLILFVLTATACNETPPNNDKPEDDQKRKTTAPIATIQKEFLLAALKMDDLDEKNNRTVQGTDQRVPRAGKSLPKIWEKATRSN